MFLGHSMHDRNDGMLDGVALLPVAFYSRGALLPSGYLMADCVPLGNEIMGQMPARCHNTAGESG
jgi:hypothetical protein